MKEVAFSYDLAGNLTRDRVSEWKRMKKSMKVEVIRGLEAIRAPQEVTMKLREGNAQEILTLKNYL